MPNESSPIDEIHQYTNTRDEFMGWNEPNDNNRDPWGGRRNEQGPPDLDEIVRKMQDKLSGLFGRRPRGPQSTQNEPSASVWVLVGVLAVLVLGYEMFWRIDSAERGVVLRFGKYVTTLQPGPHFRLPRPIEKVIKVNIEQIRGFTVSARMLTKDENISDLELAVQYRIKDVSSYLLKIADPDETVTRTAESAIRETIGRNGFDFVINEGRAQVAADAGKLMQEMLDVYQSGIEVTSVNMLSATAPEEVKSAFDDAIKSREDKQRKINEAEAYRNENVERAQGEAARIRLESEAYQKQVVSRAEGEASRFEQLLTAFEQAPEVTRQRLYLETVEQVLAGSNKVLIEGNGGGNLTYLPLDKLLERVQDSDDSTLVQDPSVPDLDKYPTPGSLEDRQREVSRLREAR
ncbi:MAG: FtsH protease activity modulator HflK [Gammaproteobacteria bacterium]|nr:FtsH protease activity modulator HflK [Gammaproteobacteria bacterium]